MIKARPVQRKIVPENRGMQTSHTEEPVSHDLDLERDGSGPRFFFDRRDYELLRIVKDISRRKGTPAHRRLLAPYLHPHGIKEMAAQRALRIAYAVAHLLDSLEIGKASDRLEALRSLREEILYTAQGPLRVNASRVLIEIMKRLLRSQEDDTRQLELAHDFRAVTTGRPRTVREQLRKYHLLEMPEEWNQVSFDDHVHDVNTKGRKSASHLVMDAWIKGIRRLTVIYYHFVPREAAEELLEAAAIMDIKVRIGIEFFTRHQQQFVKIIWIPRGLTDSQGFLSFLSSPAVQAFMDQGRQVAKHHEAYVLEVLREFNRTHLPDINDTFGLDMPPICEKDFLSFVGSGQVSIFHLGKLIHERLLPLMRTRTAGLHASYRQASDDEKAGMEQLVRRMDGFDAHEIIERHLRPERNPGLPDPDAPSERSRVVPELRTLSIVELLDRLYSLHPKHRVVLDLDGLAVEHVLELLYDCRGRITHLEIFNLKNSALGREPDRERILRLQAALHSSNVMKLKRFITELIAKPDGLEGDGPGRRGHKDKLVEILYELPAFQACYRDKPLKISIGSDSTGQSGRMPGMGLVVKDSLPRHVQLELERASAPHCGIPVGVTAYARITRVPLSRANAVSSGMNRLVRRIPGLSVLGYRHKTDWVIDDCKSASEGNIHTLGGVQRMEGNGLHLVAPERKEQSAVSLEYLNTGLKIGLKILAGFLAASLTFALTKNGWLLAYGGALIWFAITGLRIIIQSVLGCGGIHRSSRLKWESYVSWDRLADSLLFSGLSVPLLDYIVKTVLLERSFGVTVTTSPVLLYAAMSLVNGLYMAGHNLLRGLPREAIVGNLLRSILAIPLALACSGLAGELLLLAGVTGVGAVLQQWAAVITKLASDCVAGVIEGLADRAEHLRMRIRDYSSKLKQLFALHGQVEVLFPLEDVPSLLESKEFIQTLEFERSDLLNIAIVNALDLQYLWMYQPWSRNVIKQLVREMGDDERRVFLFSQYVLSQERQISQLLLDGLVGRNFSKALAFYVGYWREYLKSITRLVSECSPGLLRHEKVMEFR